MEKMKGYAESFPPCSQLQELPALTTSTGWAGLCRVPRQHPEDAEGGEPLLC